MGLYADSCDFAVITAAQASLREENAMVLLSYVPRTVVDAGAR